MAPTPTIPKHDIPKLHLQCLDMSHEGSQQFFSHTSSPHVILQQSSKTVLEALYPPNLVSEAGGHPSPCPPTIRSVTLHLRPFGGVAHTCGSDLDEEHKEVHLSTEYISSVRGDSKRISHEIRGVVVHELVHVFQWNGRGSVPGGVIEGIADWVRLGADLGPPHWREGGDHWDAGYQTTAYFLAWLSTAFRNPLLVPQLNLAMRSQNWDNGRVLKALCNGHSLDELWEEYKDDLERRRRDQTEEEDSPSPVPTHDVLMKQAYNVAY